MTLLTKFATKKAPTAYEALQSEIGCFAPTAHKAAATSPKSADAAKLMFNNIPQTPSALVARLHADIARVDAMTDAFGKEITQERIAKLSAFLVLSNIAF